MCKKVCNKCDLEFELKNFPIKSKNKNTFYPWCKKCHKEYRNKYYNDNKNKILKQDKLTSNERKDRNRQYIWDYLKNNPCVDCGEDNPIVLEFDHKDEVEKIDNISRMVSGKWSLNKIQKEIDKCDVRCANCHHIRTSIQQEWYKNVIK